MAEIDSRNDYTIIGAKNYGEFLFYMDTLSQQGFLSLQEYTQHLDTRQYNTIDYSDAIELEKRLLFRIEANLGKGPNSQPNQPQYGS